jgi:DNA-binding Lrp family transcriptional regulator
MRRVFELDDKDRQLIALLREDARTPTAALARSLGVARMTVVERLKRLEEAGIIAGYTVRLGDEASRGVMKVHALLRVDPKKGDAVVQALRRITQIRAAFAISGVFNCMALIEAETTGEIDTVLDAIGSIPGVEGTQSSIVLSVSWPSYTHCMFRRTARSLSVTILVVLSLLFSQLALANYVCPMATGQEPGVMEMAPGEPCEGMATEQAPSVLCFQHCTDAPQSFDAVKLPTVSIPAVVFVLAIPATLDGDAQDAGVHAVIGAAQPPPEPLFLSTLRLRV